MTIRKNPPASEEQSALVQPASLYPGQGVDTLLAQGQLEDARKELEQLIVEGLESGDPVEATPEFWKELRAKLHRDVRSHPARKTA